MEKPIQVTAPLLPDFDEYCRRLESIWDTKWMTNNGPLVCELTERLSARMDGRIVELFSNGHMALDIAIRALDLKGEVITTPFTFASTTHALVMNGIKPVFCDINGTDYTMDADRIEALITPQTTAIVPVHVYGCVCDVERIERIAKAHRLRVIYDAAHAMNVRVRDRSIACFGDISMFSFHATKVFNTIEGGALAFADPALDKTVCHLRNFGIENAESVTSVGGNAKMNEFSAAMGLCNLDLLEDAIVRRSEIVQSYVAWADGVCGIKRLPYEQMDARGIVSNYSYMPIEIDEQVTGFTRDQLCAKLAEDNIFARKYFYPLTVDYACYRGQFDRYALPVARRVSARILTLPLAADMADDDVSRCIKALDRACRQLR